MRAVHAVAVNQPQQPPMTVHYGPGVPTPPRKRMSRTTGRLIALGAVLLLCCVLPAAGGLTAAFWNYTPRRDNPAAERVAPAPAAVETTAPAQPATSAPAGSAGPATSFGPGMYEVGVDIKPGTYTCTTDSGLSAYWERSRDASGEFDAIIANGNIKAGTQGIITIKVKEFFKINRGRCIIR